MLPVPAEPEQGPTPPPPDPPGAFAGILPGEGVDPLPPPPPVDIIVEKIEFEPLGPVELPVAVAPAPTVIGKL